MSRMRERVLIPVLVALSSMTVLAACGDESEGSLESLPMLTAVPPTSTAPVAEATTTTGPKYDDEFYLVQQGDSLSAIAESFGVKVEDVMAANGISNPDKIQAGQKLIIPSGSAPTTTTSTTSPSASTTGAP
jgi:LysM repeat protein